MTRMKNKIHVWCANKIRVRADKTSQKAFKITANVKTSVLQILEELWGEDD